MKIKFITKIKVKTGALIVNVNQGLDLSPSCEDANNISNGAISRAFDVSKFSGKKNQLLEILSPSNMDCSRLIIAGIGKEMNEIDAQSFGATLYNKLNAVDENIATLIIDGDDQAQNAANIAFGMLLKSYKFNKYMTGKKNKNDNIFKDFTIQLDNASEAEEIFKDLKAIADGVFIARDLVSEPPNILYPASMANEIKKLETLGIDVKILGEDQMRKLGMGALLGVGQGSIRESKLVVMNWNGGDKDTAPLAFIGKGVTFDTGGISLKPGAGMEEMKFDMGGSAVVIGLMKALAGRKAKVNVVGVVGLAENMPDGNAQRPGDIVTSMSGQTIEIINTDAEGRLVLADCLYYTQDRFKPQFMINLATLTGAIMVSLGSEYAGFFSNDDQLSEKLTKAGIDTGEKLWRMPLHKNYDKLIKSNVADMKNIGGRFAGAITAAQFLEHYVNDCKWAHIDIAGTTWSNKDMPLSTKGATGYGVCLLDRLIRDNYA